MNLLKKAYRLLHPRFQVLYPDYKTQFTPRYGYGKPPHKGLYDIINSYRSSYEQFLQQMTTQPLLEKLQAVGSKEGPLTPKWDNNYFGAFDMMVAYTMLATYKPETYMEVGSGNSTKLAALAVKEQGLDTKIISIDPYPRAQIDVLANTIIRQPFETVDQAMLLNLKENDILFIDNSHRIFPNSDCTVFYLEILPYLAKGVIVQIHDIFLPYDYSQELCDRFYSEQYGLAINLLTQSTRYQPIFANYFVYEDAGLQKIADPLWNSDETKSLSREGGSFWLKIA